MRVHKDAKPLALILVALLMYLVVVSAQAEQTLFPTADEAVTALIEAAGAEGNSALLAVLGPEAEYLISSGDPVADENARQQFVAAAAEATQIELENDQGAILIIGSNSWPFPIPLVKEASGWRFDTAAGKEELINRRIGRNELHTIATVRAIVDAQHEYFDRDPDGDGTREYAQNFGSTEGARDGLFWPVGEGEAESPLGPLVASAVAEGYRGNRADEPVPYHGYFFRILKAQGANAPGGARDYVDGGRMTGGFAVVAYPADYGNSGIMTIVAGQRGLLFQKDLGVETDNLAKTMTEYDPDSSWSPVVDTDS